MLSSSFIWMWYLRRNAKEELLKRCFLSRFGMNLSYLWNVGNGSTAHCRYLVLSHKCCSTDAHYFKGTLFRSSRTTRVTWDKQQSSERLVTKPGRQEIRGKEVHSQRAFKPNTTSAVAATGQLRCTDADPLQPLTRAFCVGFNIDIYLNWMRTFISALCCGCSLRQIVLSSPPACPCTYYWSQSGLDTETGESLI